MHPETEAILRRAEEVLATAEVGLSDVMSSSPTRRDVGLRNLIVFGRSVTFVLQNLRGKEPDFDAWYQPIVEKMKGDPTFRYFLGARNVLEKQGKVSTNVSAHIKSFNTNDINKFGRKPSSDASLFFGDNLGGSGWEVKLPNGETIKYYTDLPAEIGTVERLFSNLGDEMASQFPDGSVEEISGHYLKEISIILDDARRKFLGKPSSEWIGSRRLPSFIKVIK